jgi:hypothetical protein
MKLSEAIEFLCELKDTEGDVEIWFRDDEGNPVDSMDIQPIWHKDAEGKTFNGWIITG